MIENTGFKHWNKPYLFQELEDVYRSLDEEQQKSVISLAIGDPDIPTPDMIRKAMAQEHLDCYYGYPSVEGRLDLRCALSGYYTDRFDVNVDPSEIYIGPGAKTDLFDMSAVFANPGDQAAILDPAYPVYCDGSLFRGLNIVFLPGNPQNRYMPDLPEDKIKPGALALIFMCYPNNPTGAMATEEYVEKMVHFANKHQALIVHDIAYADFNPGNAKSGAFSIFSIPGAEKVGIEIGSFSKPFSMTGDRIGWVAIKNPRAKALWRRYRSNRDSGVSEFDQAGALAALTSREVKIQVKLNMAEYGRRADVFTHGLKMAGIEVDSLRNSPYAWFKSPIPDSRKAARILLEKSLIQVTPGVGFGPGGEGYLRATIFQPMAKIHEAVNRFLKTDFSIE